MTDQTTRIEQIIKHENKPRVKFLARLFGYVFSSARAMCMIFLMLSVFLSLLRPAVALVWREFLDAANTGADILSLILLIAAYFAIDYVSNMLVRYTEGWEDIERLDIVQRNRFMEKFDARMYKRLSKLPPEYFEIPAINDRVERVFQFTQDAWNGLNRKIMVEGYMIISKIISVAAICLSLMILDKSLMWIALIAPIPALYTTLLSEKLHFRLIKDNTKQQREASYYEGLMLGPASKEMKTLGLYDFFFAKWKELTDDYIIKQRKTQRTSTLLNLASSMVSGLAVAGAMILAIMRMITGRLTLGGLGAAMSLSNSLTSETSRLFSSIGAYLSKKNEAAMFFDLIDLPDEPNDGASAPIKHIEARNLRYRYPGTQTYALENVNITLGAGEHVALVGENGAGKTTFVRLLTGMLTPSEGEIQINGAPALISRREQMATVSQSPARYYTFTVGDNVVLGDVAQNSSPERGANTEAAMRAAGFDAAPPDALLGKDIGGIELSGGEWQKLSIARAIYRERDFVVLDEPTGNLDAKAEADVFQRYMDMSEGKTLIMVTHRISVASLASRVIVFAGGKIVEDGTHAELIKANGEYAWLYGEQAKWYDR